MKWRLSAMMAVLACCAGVMFVGCGDDAPTPAPPLAQGGSGGTTSDGGSTSDGGASDGGSSFTTGGTGGEGGSSDICSEQDVTLQLAGVRAMLLLDYSTSMNSGGKWTAASNAITALMDDPDNADTWFGLQVFPVAAGGDDKCNVDAAPPVELAADTHDEIKQWLVDNASAVGNGTPLIGAIEEFLYQPTSPLHNDDTANFLIVIADGNDGCFLQEAEAPESLFCTDENPVNGVADCIPTFTPADKAHMLGAAVHDLKDFAGIKTIAIGFGAGVSEEELNLIAANGGTQFTTFLQADDQTELESALDEISQAIRPCRFELDSPDASASPSKVNFYFDSTLVPRDLTNADGWNWAKSEALEVEFFGAACTQIKDRSVTNVTATFGCPTKVGVDEEVCADKDFFLPFPDVAVMLLQDFSGSMKVGQTVPANGVSPGNPPTSSTDPLAGGNWTDATSAITTMLLDDRNNRVEFGLDIFPDNTATVTKSCDTNLYPDVPVGSYNTYTIIDMISHLEPTTGSDDDGNSIANQTPLIDSLTRYTYNPGRIGEDDVSGSLVVISDGADSASCSPGITTADKPGLLAAATAAIVADYGIKVFAIGFGGVGTNGAAQLDAIATNGGTGLTEHYEADNQQELEALFGQISSLVSSCVFDVPHAGNDVDYDKVNFYFDGEVIPRDTTHTNGWDWVNPVSKTQVEFYGTACAALQGGDVADVLVEFGCEPIVVN